MNEIITLHADTAGVRLDKWLSEQLEALSRSQLQRLMQEGAVLVNGTPAAKNLRLCGTEQITILLPPAAESGVEPENIPLDIVYEDHDLLVVNKPKGMVVHPAPGHMTGTLVHGLLYHCGESLSGIGGVQRPGIVHRIDRLTSGLLMVAKNNQAHRCLAEQIAAHSFTRMYAAVAMGRFREASGTVHAPIGRHPVDRKRMCVTEKNSKDAITHYTVTRQFDRAAQLEVTLETGRTHQIRVHMAYIGHPVLGDDVYGKPWPHIEGQCLHAQKIGFIHPTTGQYLCFEAPLPDYFTRILRGLS